MYLDRDDNTVSLVFEDNDEELKPICAMLDAANLQYAKHGSNGNTYVVIERKYLRQFVDVVESTFWVLHTIRNRL